MDIYTKAFLLNMVTFVFTVFVDANFLGSFLLVKAKGGLELIINIWVVATVLSIPAILVYLILRA